MPKYLSLILLLSIASAANANIVSYSAIQPQIDTVALDTPTPQTIARQIAVKIKVGNRRGSGTIVAKRDNRYLVLTNAHVVSKGQLDRLTTSDGKTHPFTCLKGCSSDQFDDLALLEFTTTTNYTVPQWGNTKQLELGATIYSAGFPFEQQSIEIVKGSISMVAPKPLIGGYQIGYTSRTAQGMSGGPLLDASGHLIGIIGFNSYPILNEGYQYQDGSQPLAIVRKQMRKSSFAIPIELAKINAGSIANRPVTPSAPSPLPSAPLTPTPIKKYTGIVKQIDDIAQQITVRIENKSGNGSGVIIARSGNTYSVVTAAHVVKDKQGYEIITPTQERINLKPAQVTLLNQDLDIALVTFTSAQNYRTAELANYQFKTNDWVFVSGFPGRDPKHQRNLSAGVIRERDRTDFNVKDLSSLINGNNLIYTNLSLPGMSGGAVLDRQGKLVGINTGAENEAIITKDNRREEINFGYALGIPTTTIVGAVQGQIPSVKLTTTPQPPLGSSDSQEIRQYQLSTLSAPSQASTVKEWLDYGNLLWRAQEFKQAVTAFDRAISILKQQKIRPDKEQYRIAHFGKGLALRGLRRHPEAIAAFEVATSFDPQFMQAWRYHAKSLYQLKRYTAALSSYQKAIELDPQNFVLHVERGDVLRTFKRYPESIASLDRAIQLKPNHPWAYRSRGGTYVALKQRSLALADFSQAIKLNPQWATAYLLRGSARIIMVDRPELALADIDRAIQLDPRLTNAYIFRGGIYSQLKQFPQAIASINKAIELDPKSLQAYAMRGIIHAEMTQYPQAMADFNKVIQLDPQNAGSYAGRGAVYLGLKQLDKAKADLEKAAQLLKQQGDESGYQSIITLLKTL
jgi:tetratricopeptide (TPR) repeat protein/S1-C subfamily serine protease